MIGILRNLNATVMAIDQPIDFTVPESTVMLAVYSFIPEAENTKRSLTYQMASGERKYLEHVPKYGH